MAVKLTCNEKCHYCGEVVHFDKGDYIYYNPCNCLRKRHPAWPCDYPRKYKKKDAIFVPHGGEE